MGRIFQTIIMKILLRLAGNVCEERVEESGCCSGCEPFQFRPRQFKEQIRIVSEVMHSRNYNPELKRLVKGVMIESYLVEGRQDISENHVYGQSITDPCLGWEDTEKLIYSIAERNA